MGTFVNQNASVNFIIYLRDPCLLVNYQSTGTLPDHKFYKPNYPPITFYIERFIEEVVDYNLTYPNGVTYTDQNFCGDFTYELVQEDLVTPFTAAFLTLKFTSRIAFTLYTTDNSY